ncbi:MAG: NAD(P)/FAD-dependent oxidoreductase [Alphaproteobacteria bacterium]|nr:NAD(P)/FAD-dependent oxidoreductase [Alphaproteobacteria bacterium]
MSDWLDAVVVGAGVVGLAVARRLALAGLEVIVLEQAETIGSETSSRNSEVIHAGIYYSKDSLKALTCVAGKQQLYAYCESRKVPHRRCGKLVVASDQGEVALLEGIRLKAAANGVTDLRFLTQAEIGAMEPELQVTGALFSPTTGIIDSHALMLAYQGEAEAHGAVVAFHSRLDRAMPLPGGFALEVSDLGNGGATTRINARWLVNSAGLNAPALARRIEGLPQEHVPPAYYCKGSYFSLHGKQPFRHLVYPVPRSASLGVHVTIDLAGQMRFGPDQEWIEQPDYNVDIRRADEFYAAVRRYWPGLPDGGLQPAYAGIRPKIQAPDEPARDFLIEGPSRHGLAGLVNLFGIESPGLTASLALADRVARSLGVNA